MTDTLPGGRLRAWRRTHQALTDGRVVRVATVARLEGYVLPAFSQPALARWLTLAAQAQGRAVSSRTVRRWEAGRCPRWAYALCEGACE